MAAKRLRDASLCRQRTSRSERGGERRVKAGAREHPPRKKSPPDSRAPSVSWCGRLRGDPTRLPEGRRSRWRRSCRVAPGLQPGERSSFGAQMLVRVGRSGSPQLGVVMLRVGSGKTSAGHLHASISASVSNQRGRKLNSQEKLSIFEGSKFSRCPRSSSPACGRRTGQAA